MMVISGMVIGWLAADVKAGWVMNTVRVLAGVAAVFLAYCVGKGLV